MSKRYISRTDPTISIEDPTLDETGRYPVGPGHYIEVEVGSSSTHHGPWCDEGLPCDTCAGDARAKTGLDRLIEDMRHTHRIDDAMGYRVVEVDPCLVATNPGTTIAWFAANRYGSAVEVAESIRRDDRRAWATIDVHYSCGCVSIARAPGEVGIADVVSAR